MERLIKVPPIIGTNTCPVCGHSISTIKNIQFNDKFYSIQINSTLVKLGPLRYKILKIFFKNPGQFLSSERLWAIIQDRSRSGESENLLRTTISHLRKIIRYHKLPFEILNNYNVGYVLIKIEGKND